MHLGAPEPRIRSGENIENQHRQPMVWFAFVFCLHSALAARIWAANASFVSLQGGVAHFETFAPTLGRSVYDLSNEQKYVVSCLWFDVAKLLFNNLSFVFEVVFLNPQGRKTDSGSQPSSRNAEGQLLQTSSVCCAHVCL